MCLLRKTRLLEDTRELFYLIHFFTVPCLEASKQCSPSEESIALVSTPAWYLGKRGVTP